MVYSSGPRAAACSGWTGRGQLCSWDTQPGFRWVSPPTRDPVGVSQAQPLHPSLSSVPAWEQRVLPEQEMLLSVRLAGSSSSTPLPRDRSAVPGGEHPSLQDPASSSCMAGKATSLPLPACRASRSHVQSIGLVPSSLLRGDQLGWRWPGALPHPQMGVAGGSPCPPGASSSPPAPPGSLLRPLAVGCPKQIDFIFPFVNKGGESTVS